MFRFQSKDSEIRRCQSKHSQRYKGFNLKTHRRYNGLNPRTYRDTKVSIQGLVEIQKRFQSKN